MSSLLLRAALGLSFVAALSACVPVGLTTPSPVTAAVPDAGIYLATSDNGIAIPAVDPAKVPQQFQRQVVDFPSTEAPGTVIVNPGARQLYFVTGKGKAIRYGISVGKAGFEWSGEARVTNRRAWPRWTPPPEMIARKPSLAKWENGQPGGPTNPLGARALYLTTDGVDHGYRIHGTPDWWTIGKNASSGCIRMINQDVLDLYARVPDGAKVIVLTRDGAMPSRLKLPPPAPRTKAPETRVMTPAPTTAPMGPFPAAPDARLPGIAPTVPAAATVPSAAASPVSAAPTGPERPDLIKITPTPEPATTPASVATPIAPACNVPLVNRACPQT
jgi:lipoprotein-anchoring transpeptidase ErfK/SrfK